ncbi:2-dehydropantoate 2-reductase [Thalassospiraceae bacterium LMO-SO8]|nr:2-dehydropantoate 2-reductase [Alphaproteobacteria bacterium LMO-S08]WND75297.1 2-dehydropantoate 2-reductase [Thalassospiraceae bacterium LMO-SO8]
MAGTERIAVYGAGAVGAYVGGYMTRDGRDVTLIDPWAEHVALMRDPGLKLSGLTEPENFTVVCNAVLDRDLPPPGKIGPFDVIFICVKSFDTEAAAKRMLPYLADGGFMVSLQNGINEGTIAGVVGAERTVGCIASSISVSMWEPGAVRRNVKLGGKEHVVFRAGELDGSVTPRVERIAEILSSVDSSKVTTTLMGERWSKLIVNCMRNPISAASGMASNACDTDDHIRRLGIRIGAEAVEVAMAEGHPLEKLLGMTPEQVLAAGKGDADAMAACDKSLLDGRAKRSDQQRPSMAQDMVKGRPTEIDFLNGFVALKAKAHGIAVPANEGIVAAIKRIEAGEIEPSPDALAGI